MRWSLVVNCRSNIYLRKNFDVSKKQAIIPQLTQKWNIVTRRRSERARVGIPCGQKFAFDFFFGQTKMEWKWDVSRNGGIPEIRFKQVRGQAHSNIGCRRSIIRWHRQTRISFRFFSFILPASICHSRGNVLLVCLRSRSLCATFFVCVVLVWISQSTHCSFAFARKSNTFFFLSSIYPGLCFCFWDGRLGWCFVFAIEIDAVSKLRSVSRFNWLPHIAWSDRSGSDYIYQLLFIRTQLMRLIFIAN